MMTEARLNRIKDLADWIGKTSGSKRKDSLEAFAKTRKVSYETVKKDAITLSYAVMPGNDFRRIPKSRRKEIKELQKAIEKGKIDRVKAGSSAFDFIMMNPSSDVERLNRLYPLKDEKSLKMQEKIAGMVQEIAYSKVERGTHPVRAQSEAWREVGNKIHNEIQTAVKITPASKLNQTVREIWANNFLKLQAELNYEKGQTSAVKRLGYELSRKNKGASMPVWWKDFLIERYGSEKVKKMAPEEMLRRMQSDYKNLKRHQRPGKERKIPADLKNALKRVKDKAKYQEFAKAGRHYKAGDAIWKEMKEKEKSLHKRLRSGRKR